MIFECQNVRPTPDLTPDPKCLSDNSQGKNEPALVYEPVGID